ncbi:MAG: type II secretion system F family protein [Terriglobales bacterium]
MIRVEFLLAALAVPVLGGIAITRLRFQRNLRQSLALRLARFTPANPEEAGPVDLLKKEQWHSLEPVKQFVLEVPGLEELKAMLREANLEDQLARFVFMLLILLAAPIVGASIFGVNTLFGLAAGLILDAVAIFILKGRAEGLRARFSQQLPDAIDLMVAVLRSGHSVSQAVKAVAQEIPSPCGGEFEAIMQRMNLGHPLSDSLFISTRRFRSYELDLMARAVAIQNEVGGSLAELLDKTNFTLRQRLKLARQVMVLTAQSRLSARIVGLMPFFLAAALNVMSPGYLQTLVGDKLGQMLLCVALVLQLIGMIVMQRMSTVRV